MHYLIYPKGKFGKEIATLLDYLVSKGEEYSYEFIDDSIPEISLSAVIRRGLNGGTIMLASEKVKDKLLARLDTLGIIDYIDGTSFYDDQLKNIGKNSAEAYWDSHMVIGEDFSSAEESWDYFEYNSALDTDYRKFIPIEGLDGLRVLDYGCGPGNELVGILTKSTPKQIIGADISKLAMERAKRRLALHGKSAEFIWIDENNNKIPLPDESIDYINCPGVLMNALDLDTILSEFNRVLVGGGAAAIMVYNYDSIWLHLYAAYLYRIEHPELDDQPLSEIYRRVTDGEHCPISKCYKPEEFIKIMERHGFSGELSGIAMILDELMILPRRFEAIQDRRLPKEHRDFLMNLTFDNRGWPMHNGRIAGTNACYRFVKKG